MTIGRTDDPENPFGATAIKAAFVFGAGSRTPSGPAVMVPRQSGRTHDRNRPTRQNSHFSSCIRGAVHTCTNAALPGLSSPMTLSDTHLCRRPAATLRPLPSPIMGLPRLPASAFRRAVPTTPADQDGCACRLLPRSRGLPRFAGGSASAPLLSRCYGQAAETVRPRRCDPEIAKCLSRIT
jgi:hypothetical protein